MSETIDTSAAQDEQVALMCQHARQAAQHLAGLSAEQRSRVVETTAASLNQHQPEIKQANAADVAAAGDAGLAPALIDRLTLNDERFAAMVAGVRSIAHLPDPIGAVLRSMMHKNGMVIDKVRVPLGVIGIIYESRPNVTADAAALCLKAGNAVILRGGSEALRTNAAIHQAIVVGLSDAGCPVDAVQFIATPQRAAVTQLLQMDRWVDLIIPRGGEGLIRAVTEQSRIPVLKHYKGVCHVYVDTAADLEMAERIVINAKCQRPGVCNAAETLLVHRSIASEFLPRVGAALQARHVELRGDAETCRIINTATLASEDDWYAEYLDLVLSIRIVDSVEQAIEHINHYGSRHSDVIVSGDTAAHQRFVNGVDSAAVYINASSRFTDGAEFGLGAEVGISTDKLHARGPCGVEELTTYKYIIRGSGQIRLC